MKLIYKCSNCGQAKEFDAPTGMALEDVFKILDGYRFANMREQALRKWIRHPCAPGMHGIANLVAVLEN